MELCLDAVDVSLGERPRKLVLSSLSLTIEPGSFVAVVGPSGCGKTTLLRTLGGLVQPSAGSVTVGEQSADVARRHKHVGYLPQKAALMPWASVNANASLLQRVNTRHARAGLPSPVSLLSDVGLVDVGDAKPSALSGGMAQRVALARTFALGAPVLLVDEPFSALDERTRSDLGAQLVALWEQRRPTVVMVTHDVDEAVRCAQRVIVLAAEPGRIVADIAVSLAVPRPEPLDDNAEFRATVRQIRDVLAASVVDRSTDADVSP